MNFRFTPEQRQVQQSARGWLAAALPHAALRRALADGPAASGALWRRMADELGWAGATIPEAHGGAGLGPVELAILMEETGAVLAPVPLFATLGLAVPAILAAGSAAQKAELLPAIAAGAAASLAFTGAQGRPGLDGIGVDVLEDGAGWRLRGTAGFVPHAAQAAHIVIAARAPGSRGRDGVSLAVLAPGAEGMTIAPQQTLDETRPYAAIHFVDAPLAPARILGPPGQAAPALAHALAHGAAMLAAEQLGGAARLLDMTVEYAKTRVQFGRPVGGFQAVKHKLADMMLRVESARSAAYYAACIAADAPDQLGEAASIARAYCSDAYTACAADAVQLHGGIGFTWEHPAQLYFKRARASATLLGDPAWHRDIVARFMGLEDDAA